MDDPSTATDSGDPVLEDKEILCGPLLNYRRMEGTRWHGSVLIVTGGSGKPRSPAPTLTLARADSPGWEDGKAIAGEVSTNSAADGPDDRDSLTSREEKACRCGGEIQGVCLYSDVRCSFWAFDLVVDMEATETQWEYTFPGMRFASKTKPRRNSFFVPSTAESFRILFYSCNDFGDGFSESDRSRPALWADVLRRHSLKPWNVMIGGGDQIYNDGVVVDGPLRPWTDIRDPNKRRDHPFPEQLRQDCDEYYWKNYIRWYSTEPFASVNGRIPQLNIWDDHDIIDGYGSYVDEFMKCDVFMGIGAIAYKYYLLFQHHLQPPPSPTHHITHGAGMHPRQDTNMALRRTDPSYILGPRPGPYILERSHSIFARLGARIGFLGIDARTERTRHQVNYPETYDAIFSRLEQELQSAKSSGQAYKHLILLLGIPVAYPVRNLLSKEPDPEPGSQGHSALPSGRPYSGAL